VAFNDSEDKDKIYREMKLNLVLHS